MGRRTVPTISGSTGKSSGGITLGKACYRIRVRGYLPPSWSDRLGGMAIESDGPGPDSVSTITGELTDQSALAGVINALIDHHLPVLSVERLHEGEATPERVDP